MVMANQPRRRFRWAWVGVGVLLVVVLLVAAGATLKVVGGGTGSIDPTEDTFAVSLKNDTGATVLLKQCDVKCNEFHEQDRLAPGGTVPVNTTAADVANWWVVQDSSGRVLGCLNLQYNHKVTGAVVNTSATVLCPK